MGSNDTESDEFYWIFGYFETGTKVRVIARNSLRGYDLKDEDGNRIYDTGFDSIA